MQAVKRLILVLALIPFFIRPIFAHKEWVHQHLVKEAYWYLENQIGLQIPDLKNHIGLDVLGPTEALSPYIATGAWREDIEDIVYRYGAWGNGWSPSCTHFWSADAGDEFRTNIPYQTPDCENAWQKARAFLFGQHGIIRKKNVCFDFGPTVGQEIQYNSLIDFYLTGQCNLVGYMDETYVHQSITPLSYTMPIEDARGFVYQILGRVAHLLHDMSVPAHVHNDMHPCDVFEPDSYELYMGGNDWSPLYCNESKTNFPAQSWNKTTASSQGNLIDISGLNDYDAMRYLFYTLNQLSDHFPSGRNSGWPYNSEFNAGDNYLYNGVNPYLLSRYAALGPSPSSLNNQAVANESFNFAIRATATLYKWFADKVGLTYTPLPPPPAHLWTAGSYVGYGAANSYFSSAITIGNNGGQNLFYAVNYRYRNYDCGAEDPQAPLLPYNYVYVPNCPDNMGWLTPNQQTAMSVWQYRPNIYIPAGEYFRAFYNYAEVAGGVNSTNLVNIWGYVGSPPPVDNCGGGGDEPNLAMKSNPETELFNKAFSKSLQTSNMSALSGKILKNHKSVIESYPDSTIACYALNSLITQVGKNTDSLKLFIDYLDDIQSRLSNKKIGAYAQYIRSQFEEDFDKRIDVLDKLYKKHSTTPLGLIAIADKFYQYLVTKQDSLARLIAEEIIHAYPGSPIIQEIGVALGDIPYSNISELFQKPLANEDRIQIQKTSTNEAKIASLTNYPNPFNPSTVLTFTICESIESELSIYNITGQKIRTLQTGHQQEGVFNIVWDGHDNYGAQVASGIYLAILKMPTASISRKIVLMK